MASDPSGALMTTEQFKQVRDYNSLGAEDRVFIGDWNSMPFDYNGGGFGQGGGGGGGGGGGSSDYSAFWDEVFIRAANAGKSDKERQTIFNNGSFGHWESFIFASNIKGDGKKNLDGVGVGSKWVSESGENPWLAFKGINGLSFQFSRYDEQQGALGIKIKLGYNDEAGYNDLNWVQTVTTNKPLPNKSWQ